MRFSKTHEASADGDLPALRQIIADDPQSVTDLDDRGGSPLHSACFAGELEAVRLLLDCGADVRLRNRWQETPLHEAAKEGWEPVVALLLEQGAAVDIEARTTSNATPLFLAACRFGLGKEAVATLLRHGAKLDLNSAMWLEEFALVLESLDRDDWRTNALFPDSLMHQAVIQERGDILLCLLDRGVDVDALGTWYATPLNIACEHGDDIRILELLLEQGANVNAINPCFGLTPAAMATKLKHFKQLEILKKYGG